MLQIACETFCLDDDDTLLEVALSLGSEALSATTVRFVEAELQPTVKGTIFIISLFNRVFRFMIQNTILYKILLSLSFLLFSSFSFLLLLLLTVEKNIY